MAKPSSAVIFGCWCAIVHSFLRTLREISALTQRFSIP